MKILSALLLSLMIGGNALALYPSTQDKRDIVINAKGRNDGQAAASQPSSQSAGLNSSSSQRSTSAAKPTPAPTPKPKPKPQSGKVDSFFDISGPADDGDF